MSIWTVKPVDVKYELQYITPDGAVHPFWVKFKKDLTIGEQRKSMTAGWLGMGRDSSIQIDWQKQTFARTEAYLSGWSLTNDADATMPTTRECIEALPGAVYALIEEALNTHVEASAEEKKPRTGEISPSATSA